MLSCAVSILLFCVVTNAQTSNDATLSRLALTDTDSGDGIALIPAFDPAVRQYSAEASVGAEIITLDAVANHAGATLKYLDVKENELADADEEKDGFQAALTLGATILRVRVEAENGMKWTYTVGVFRPGPPLSLSFDTVAGDDVVNIREKADGFSIAGTVVDDKSDAMSNATVTVEIAGETLTATSGSDGTWSVDVPAAEEYVNEPSVTVTVNATKAPFLPAPEVEHTLTVDLTPPTLVSATAQDKRLDLVYDETLAQTDISTSAFSVTVGDIVLSDNIVLGIIKSSVALFLPSAISPDDTVTVSYTTPATNTDGRPIRDTADNPVGDLADHPVANITKPGELCAGSEGSVRLVDGADSKEGRVEVCADDDITDGASARWGVVCDDYWSHEDADVVCRSLGFERSEPRIERFLQSYFGAGTGPIWLDDLRCRGSEENLLDCLVQSGSSARDAIGQHNCKATEIVGVRCMAAGDPLKPHVSGQVVLTHPGEDRRYHPGDTLSVTVTFNEPVVVDSSNGTPTVGILLDDYNEAASRSARYADGSGTRRLEFRYRVSTGDGAFEELRVAGNSLATNGGTIRNTAGIDAILAHDGAVEPVERFLQRNLSVSDASAQEGAPLQFLVSLSHEAFEAISVSYWAETGTATAGTDFEAISGTLTFEPGQSEKTVSVVTLDDAHDDGGETVILTLSDARGATIADGTAIGTIVNSDPMPKAWLARFGRTAADHAVQAIGTRFGNDETHDRSRSEGAGSSLAELWQLAGLESVSGTFNSAGTGWLSDVSAWGRVTDSSFSGAEGALSLDGEASTATVGLDGRNGRWLTGIALSHSRGMGGYRHESAAGGLISSTLNSLHPYAHYSASERLSVWGVLGYGTGDLTLAVDGAGNRVHTGLDSKMLSFGGRGRLLPTIGQFELAWVSDALLTDTRSQSTSGLRSADAETSRVRLRLEGSASITLANGGVLTPTLDAGMRYDSGDAETGAGVEVGGGLAYTAGRITVQVDGRTLLMHSDSAYEEWGFSSTIVYRPRDDGRGLAFNVGSAWGVTRSGVWSLWDAYGIGHLAQDNFAAPTQRCEIELGYGVTRPKGPGPWYPYVAADTGDGDGQSLRAGFRISSGRNLDASVEIGRLVLDDGSRDHAIHVRGSLRW